MSTYRWAGIDRSKGACKEEFFSSALRDGIVGSSRTRYTGQPAFPADGGLQARIRTPRELKTFEQERKAESLTNKPLLVSAFVEPVISASHCRGDR
jgi:hypothetical protein